MLLQTNNLTLQYQDGKKSLLAVDHVNLSIPERGLFGISGPSGSGKTSLLYLLSGRTEAPGDPSSEVRA